MNKTLIGLILHSDIEIIWLLPNIKHIYSIILILSLFLSVEKTHCSQIPDAEGVKPVIVKCSDGYHFIFGINWKAEAL